MAVVTAETIGAGEAARRIGVSSEYLRQLAVAGRIPSTQTPYGRVYDAGDVERFRVERESSQSERAA